MSKKLQVTICGGGNGAHTSAGYIGSKPEFTVNVFTRVPEKWTKTIKVTTATSSWSHKGEFIGKLNKVSKDPKEVAEGTDVFIIAAPANAHPSLLAAIAPHIKKGAWVGALYAQGGFDWAAKHSLGPHFNKVDLLFGLQNIPWICKTTTQGKEARILGPKQNLYVTSYPVGRVNEAASLMTRLFDIPCLTVPNFLNLTLTPSNQIIHPPRYYGIFRDWDGKRVYTREELGKREGLTLYEDMDECSAEWMSILDNELQQIRFGLMQRYPQLDLSFVLPMGQRIVKQYGPDVKDRSSLRQIFRTNKGYVGCGTPLKEVPGGVIPALESRLFWEDIPYGLCILKDLAELLGIPTPGFDFFIEWHQQYMGVTYVKNRQLTSDPKVIATTGTARKYGLRTVADVVATSLPDTPRSKL